MAAEDKKVWLISFPSKDNQGRVVKIGVDYDKELALYEESSPLLGSSNTYALDLNLLRIPAFVLRNIPGGKNYVLYEEERKVHGQKVKLSTKIGTLDGALNPHDYDVFRGICSFIKEEKNAEGNNSRYVSCFTIYELLRKIGKDFHVYYKSTVASLKKLAVLDLIINIYYAAQDDIITDTKPVHYFQDITQPERTDRKYKFVFDSRIARAFTNRYYRVFTWGRAEKISDPLQRRLFEYLESELHGKISFHINIDKLSKRIPLQDKKKTRRQDRILKALNGLSGIFEYRFKNDTLTVWRAKILFKESPRQLPEAVIQNPAKGEWGSGHKLYALWERFYFDRYNTPYKPSYRPRVMQQFREIEQNYSEGHITKGIKTFFNDYDRSRDKKKRYWTGKAVPGHFYKFVIDKGKPAAEEAREAETQKQQLDKVRTWARESIYERLRKILPGQELPENITLDQVKALLGEDKWREEGYQFERLFQRL